LLLPLLYVGSYFAMVSPNSSEVPHPVAVSDDVTLVFHDKVHYRIAHTLANRIYWPLEKADRKLFPKRWRAGPLTTQGTTKNRVRTLMAIHRRSGRYGNGGPALAASLAHPTVYRRR
jgi:hypothetical protein